MTGTSIYTRLEQARKAQEVARKGAERANAVVTRLWLEAAGTDPGHPLYVKPSVLPSDREDGDVLRLEQVSRAAAHWHVQAHTEDYDDDGRVFAAGTVFAALDHAGDELDRIIDHVSDGITALGEAGEFEAAYERYTRVGPWAALARNASGLYEHAAAAPWLRPPLYAGPDEQDNVRRLRQAAAHCVEQINNEGPTGFRIWECSDTDCAPTDDE